MIKPLELAEKIISFSLKVKDAFKTDLETSFVASSFLLSQKSIPEISNISEDDNKSLKELHSEFKSISYDYETLRLAFSYAYLNLFYGHKYDQEILMKFIIYLLAIIPFY